MRESGNGEVREELGWRLEERENGQVEGVDVGHFCEVSFRFGMPDEAFPFNFLRQNIILFSAFPSGVYAEPRSNSVHSSSFIHSLDPFHLPCLLACFPCSSSSLLHRPEWAS